MRVLKIIDIAVTLVARLTLLASAILCFIFAGKEKQTFAGGLYMGIIFIVMAVAMFLNALTELKVDKKKTIALPISIINFATGLIFIFSNLDVNTMCFIWGLLDIISSSLLIYEKVSVIKQNKLNILKIIVYIGEITFGVLLCIKMEGGIRGHLIFLGISLILDIILLTLEQNVFKLLAPEVDEKK